MEETRLTIVAREEGGHFVAEVPDFASAPASAPSRDTAVATAAARALRAVADATERDERPADRYALSISVDDHVSLRRDPLLRIAFVATLGVLLFAAASVVVVRRVLYPRLPGLVLEESPDAELGPVVAWAGPEARTIGFYDAQKGDRIVMVGFARVHTVAEVKRALFSGRARVRLFCVASPDNPDPGTHELYLDPEPLRTGQRPALVLDGERVLLIVLAVLQVAVVSVLHVARRGARVQWAIAIPWIVVLAALVLGMVHVQETLIATWGMRLF